MKPELIVQIPPLVPEGSHTFQAQARQGDMLAAINLRPYGSNTYILEQYWDRTNRKIRRKLTPGQDERGLALVRLLKERLTKALEAAGWQDAGQNYEGRPLWRYVGPAKCEQRPSPPAHPIEAAAPAPAPPQPAQARPARKQVKVPVAAKPRVAYQRTIHARSVTFTCRQCGATITQQRFPGPSPRYCTEACKQEAMRVGTLARVHRFRAKQRAGGGSAHEHRGV